MVGSVGRLAQGNALVAPIKQRTRENCTPMDPVTVEEAIAARLTPKEPRSLSAPYALWEIRRLQLHRGVVYLRSETPSSASEIHERLRSIVADEFNLRWTWLRGFGFGAVIHTKSLPSDLHLLENCIDRRNRLCGVFQWVVFVSDEPAVAFGIHTWMEGYLSGIYRALLATVRAREIPCEAFVRDKGAFFAYAQRIVRLKGVSLAEFREAGK